MSVDTSGGRERGADDDREARTAAEAAENVRSDPMPERPWYGPEGRWKELRERMDAAEAERDALREENKKLRVLLDDVALDRAGIAGQLSAAEKLLERPE